MALVVAFRECIPGTVNSIAIYLPLRSSLDTVSFFFVPKIIKTWI
jgi:hypothetical protein